MKRKVVKKLLPFLLAIAVAGGNVYAGEAGSDWDVPGTEESGAAGEQEDILTDTEENGGKEETESDGTETGKSGEEGDTQAQGTEEGGDAGENQTDGIEGGSDVEEDPGSDVEPGSDADGNQGSVTEPGSDAESGSDVDENQGSDAESGSDVDENQGSDAEPGSDADENQGSDAEPGNDADENQESGAEPDGNVGDKADGIQTDEGDGTPGETVDPVPEEYIEIHDEITGEVCYAAEYTTEDGFKFYHSWSGNVVISGYKGTVSQLKIPGKLTYNGNTYNVEAIAERAFQNNSGLITVEIAEGITSIGTAAFYQCSNLKSVKFPASLETIGVRAFSGTVITELELKEGLTLIDDGAFESCKSLGRMNLPRTLLRIGEKAFSNTALGSVVLNNGLTELGGSAFSQCSNLHMADIPETVTTIGTDVFYLCNNLTNVSLHDGLPVIGRGMFRNTGISTIYIPDSVTSIGTDAFDSSRLGSGTVYCRMGSVADNASLYPQGTRISYSEIVVEPPEFIVTNFVGGRDVTMKSATANAVIYYSFSENITTADKFVTNGSRVSFEKGNGYLYARACYSGQWSTVSRIELKIPVVSNPTIKYSGETVTISTSTKDSTIYYTTDGTVPSVDHGTKINGSSGSFKLIKGTVKAIAVKNGCTSSAVVTSKIGPVFDASIGVPSFEVKGVIGGRTVRFQSTTKGGKIYYSSKTSSLTLQDKSVANGGTVTFEDFYGTIYARLYVDGKWSNVARLILRIPVVKTPTITQSDSKVTIRTDTPNAMIYYTTDGSKPTPQNGKKIYGSSGSFTVGKRSLTVRAIAVRSCFTTSGEASRITTPAEEVDPKIPAPSFTVKGVVGGRNVTFKAKRTNCTIYYSTSTNITTADKKVVNGGTVTFSGFYGTLYAKTYADGKWSNTSKLILKIPVVDTPYIERAGNYVNIETTTPDSVIYYTTDGSTPSPSNGYRIGASAGKVYVPQDRVVKAIAVRSGFGNSEVATAR